MPKRPSPATNAEIQRVVNLHALGHNITTIAGMLKRPRQTIGTWLERAERDGIEPGPGADSEIEKERVGVKDEIRDLKAQIRSIHRDNLTAEVVRKHIIGLAEQSPEPPTWLSKASHRGGTSVPVTNWSDWHWGEVVDPAQINGINEYSMAIAQKRARALVDRTIYLCRLRNEKFPGIVVCLGGDMISGDIHDELSESNELPTMPVLIDVYGVLITMIEKLADEFGKVFVPCVPGNHGRNTVKPRFKNRSYSNFDWLLYNFLEKHFQSDKRVQFYVPAGADAYFSVVGHRFLLTHGDTLGTHGGDGIIGILGTVLRGDFKTRLSSSAVGQPYDTLLIGHYHQYIALLRVIVNGCLKGFDEYAKLKLRAVPEPPCQALIFVNSDYGIIDNMPVYVEKPRPKDVASKFVEVFA